MTPIHGLQQRGFIPARRTLSDQLAIIARMIKGGLGTKVYMVSLDGFDTHADPGRQTKSTLHEDLASGIKTLL